MIQRYSLILLLILPLYGWSLPSDKQQPLHIAADQVQIDEDHKRDVYIGHVRLDQGSSHLQGQTMTLWRDQQGKLIRARIVGQKKHRAHYETLPKVDDAIFHAWANTIIYYAKDAYIELIGNAKAEQQQKHFHGPHLFYYVDKRWVTATSTTKKLATIILATKDKVT